MAGDEVSSPFFSTWFQLEHFTSVINFSTLSLFLLLFQLFLHSPIFPHNQNRALPYPSYRKDEIDQIQDHQDDDEYRHDRPICGRVHLDCKQDKGRRERGVGEDQGIPSRGPS